jgi:NTP pyrophosphatase (non-canonical NTP hydrolase)
MKFEELIEKTKELSERFPNKYSKQERLLDVMEEAGELAQAVLIVEGIKNTNDLSKQKTVEDVADAIGDILYALIHVARDYDRDLVKDYEQMLDRLEKRLDSGEFDKEKDNE